jgi:hypothetical protein
MGNEWIISKVRGDAGENSLHRSLRRVLRHLVVASHWYTEPTPTTMLPERPTTLCTHMDTANAAGNTAIRVLQGPAYEKTKKVPKITSEQEATELLGKVLPQ